MFTSPPGAHCAAMCAATPHRSSPTCGNTPGTKTTTTSKLTKLLMRPSPRAAGKSFSSPCPLSLDALPVLFPEEATLDFTFLGLKNPRKDQYKIKDVKDGFHRSWRPTQTCGFSFLAASVMVGHVRDVLLIKGNSLILRDLKPSLLTPPQGSAKVHRHGRGGRMSPSCPAAKGQSKSLGRSSRRCVGGRSGVRPHGRHGPSRAQRVCAVLDPQPGSRPRGRHGILRPLVLLLHLRLRVHKQRASDGAHEGSRGGHHQHHPEQAAAAGGSSAAPPRGWVRPPTSSKDASQPQWPPYLKLMCF